jgi:hypothetical protein
VVHGDHRGYVPVLAPEPPPGAQRLPERRGRAARERLGGEAPGLSARRLPARLAPPSAHGCPRSGLIA